MTGDLTGSLEDGPLCSTDIVSADIHVLGQSQQHLEVAQ